MASQQNADVFRKLQILHAIEYNAHISQRSLAESAGIALGLTNSILRRLIRKGWIKTKCMPANRLAYYLTPHGLAEKSRLVYDYIRITSAFFFRLRESVNTCFRRYMEEEGIRKVALVGTGELADAVFLSLQELGLSLTGVYDTRGVGRKWMGIPIRPLAPPVEGDLVAVTSPHADLEEIRICLPKEAHLVLISDLLAVGLQQFAGKMDA